MDTKLFLFCVLVGLVASTVAVWAQLVLSMPLYDRPWHRRHLSDVSVKRWVNNLVFWRLRKYEGSRWPQPLRMVLVAVARTLYGVGVCLAVVLDAAFALISPLFGLLERIGARNVMFRVYKRLDKSSMAPVAHAAVVPSRVDIAYPADEETPLEVHPWYKPRAYWAHPEKDHKFVAVDTPPEQGVALDGAPWVLIIGLSIATALVAREWAKPAPSALIGVVVVVMIALSYVLYHAADRIRAWKASRLQS